MNDEAFESLDEWRDYEIRKIEYFYTYYSRGMVRNPEMFPSKLPEGEFDEQYRIYRE